MAKKKRINGEPHSHSLIRAYSKWSYQKIHPPFGWCSSNQILFKIYAYRYYNHPKQHYTINMLVTWMFCRKFALYFHGFISFSNSLFYRLEYDHNDPNNILQFDTFLHIHFLFSVMAYVKKNCNICQHKFDDSNNFTAKQNSANDVSDYRRDGEWGNVH